MVRYGMVIDNFRCVRCHACDVACKSENNTPPGVTWSVVHDREYGAYPNTQRAFLSRPCMQCENSPCLSVCPTGATYRRADGIIMIDQSKCIGCKYCVLACPYGARYVTPSMKGYFPQNGITAIEQQFNANFKEGTVRKSTFCAPRIDPGEAKVLVPGVDRDATPACVIACPAEARIFGDLDDPNSDVSKAAREAQPFLGNMGTKPKVTYKGLLPPSKIQTTQPVVIQPT